ncbi:VOC family protein [Pengzhenrongella phosphoraccumulans]|uniref:VOC family protein n=1 Tax=Pengzhenrongella phosphoraccumulans TaxID=3114394 RepID=UPI0038902564
MTSGIRHVTVDCAHPYELALFWARVLGSAVDEQDRPDDEVVLVPTGDIGMLFGRVPEGKTVKNRLHVDLQPSDRTRDEEVARLLDLGAVHVDDQRTPDGRGWVVLADPEGNEFCVERGESERGLD